MTHPHAEFRIDQDYFANLVEENPDGEFYHALEKDLRGVKKGSTIPLRDLMI